MAPDFESVQVRGLVKLYGVTRALGGVDLQLQAGVITAIEGPNGAGKSTLLNLLGLLARPDGGEIRFGAYDARDAAQLRSRIGLLGHAPMVYADLTGPENLRFWADLYGVDSAERRIDELRERFELREWSERTARTFSRGQLQRLALARCLLHRPRLLLLDEPSAGLDAEALERLAAALDEERRRGVIAALATHDPTFSRRIADRHILLKRGRVQEEA